MRFKKNRFYKHPTGKCIAVLGKLKTTMFGKSLIAEQLDAPYLVACGSDEASAEGWVEISEFEWMSHFK